MEAPLTPKRILRTASAEMPAAAATSESDKPSRRIQSASRILGLPTTAPVAPAELSPVRLAEVLAVLVSELVDVLPVGDRDAVRERLANRLDGLGRTVGYSEAAVMLGAIGGAIMRLE